MIEEKYSFLNIIMFKDLFIWDAKRHSENTLISKYPIDRIKNHTIEMTKKEKIFLDKKGMFGILGVSNSNGMFDAYEEEGKNINQPYKIVEYNNIAYNPYRINVGSIGIKTNELKSKYISPAYIVMSCKNTLNPKYLFIVMKSNYFNEMIKGRTTGSVRQTLSYKNLADIKIPIPPIEIQDKLVEEFDKKILKSEDMQIKANTLENSIDKILFDSLHIEINILKNNENNKFSIINFKDVEKWGVELNLLDINVKKIFSSKKYENLPLNKVALINPNTVFKNTNQNTDNITFLPMECVSDIYGEIIERYDGQVLKTKGYTKFKERDILWAKITPCMQNGKCVIANELTNGYGYGSTEFHVIRVDENIVLTEYIYCILRTKFLRKIAMSYFSGSAGQQRVNADFLENLVIPIPSIYIQKTIVDNIFKIKNDIKINRELSESLKFDANNDFAKSIFEIN